HYVESLPVVLETFDDVMSFWGLFLFDYYNAMAKCSTCRRRKVRCDAGLPTCSACTRLGLVCQRASSERMLTWPDPDQSSVGSDISPWNISSLQENIPHRNRQNYFIVEELIATSELIQRTRNGIEVDMICHQLEVMSNEENPTTSSIGAFSIIVPKDTQLNNGLHTPKDFDFNMSSDVRLLDHAYRVTVEEVIVASQDIGHTTLQSDTTEQLSESLVLDSEANDPLQELLPGSVVPSPGVAAIVNAGAFPLVHDFDLTMTGPSTFTSSLPETTFFLLDHYKSNMLDSFTPKRNRCPPWKVLHLPSVLQAVSEISIWGSTDPVKTSLLYGILSVCAYNLEASSNTNEEVAGFWGLAAAEFSQTAREQLSLGRLPCAEDLWPRQLNEFVMATMSMNTISVMSGKFNEARESLLAAERLMEDPSAVEPLQSRETKVLRNMLQYTRVFEETTHIYPEMKTPVHCTSPSLRLPDSCIDEAPNAHLDIKFPSLRSRIFMENHDPRHLNLYTTNVPNTQEAQPNLCTTTTFEGIFGLPESLVSLISPVEIYFYREIRHVNPTSVQHLVEKALEHLLNYERDVEERGNLAAAGVCWAAFIAGCEAEGTSARQKITQFLSRIAQKSGTGNFRAASEFLPCVWESRLVLDKFDQSWREVMRSSNTCLILS
ncbi:C6 transcription factor, partial [Colletotrichum scovillei]